MVYMTLCKLYEKVDDCIICEERAEQFKQIPNNDARTYN